MYDVRTQRSEVINPGTTGFAFELLVTFSVILIVKSCAVCDEAIANTPIFFFRLRPHLINVQLKK